jgi:hypothetical protein
VGAKLLLWHKSIGALINREFKEIERHKKQGNRSEKEENFHPNQLSDSACSNDAHSGWRKERGLRKAAHGVKQKARG